MATRVREVEPLHPNGPRQRRRKGGLLLIGSLTLNLFLAAMIGGHVLHERSVGRLGSAPLTERLASLEQRLPPADARTFRQVMRRDAPDYNDAARALVVARESVERRVTAVPFDPEAVSAAIAIWREDWTRFVGNFSAALVDALTQMSPEGRRVLVQTERKRRSLEARQ